MTYKTFSSNSDFAIDLLQLLKKHKASVNWIFSDDTDTHGIRGAGISFESGGRVLLKMKDMEFDARDLEDALKRQARATKKDALKAAGVMK